MRTTQLETDLRGKKQQLATLIENTARTCEAHVVRAATATEPAVTGRLMTDDERAAIQALQAECLGIQQQLDRAQQDANLRSEVARLTGDLARPPNGGGLALPRTNLSVGAQYVQSDQYKSLLPRLRAGGQWSSGVVECFDSYLQHATTLTEDPASGGKLLVPQYLPGIVSLNFKRLVIADLMASGTTTSNSIVYMIETTFTNAAAPTAEAAAKPESALVFDQRTEPVSKIAHWIPVTEELLEDVSAIQAYIDARLRLGVQLAEEDQLLNGNGTAPNLLGLMNRSGLATAVARGTATNAEAILQQITNIATTAFVYPDGIVINPANWFTTITMKDTQGRYFGDGPFQSLPTANLWGTPVAVTPSIVAGTSLVGAYSTMAQVFRKGGIRVEASNSHQDYFIKNLVAIRAEERLALAVYRPGAFGKVTGLN